jgi:hypothetical protein
MRPNSICVYHQAIFKLFILRYVGLVILTVMTMKNTMYRGVKICSSVEVQRRFGGTHSLHLQPRKGAVRNKINFIMVYYMNMSVAKTFASNGRTINEKWMGKDMKGRGLGLIWDIISECLEELRKNCPSRQIMGHTCTEYLPKYCDR